MTDTCTATTQDNRTLSDEAAIADILRRHRDAKLGLAEAGRRLLALFNRPETDGLEQPVHWVLLEHRSGRVDDHRAMVRLLNLSRFTPETTSIADYMALIGRFS